MNLTVRHLAIALISSILAACASDVGNPRPTGGGGVIVGGDSTRLLLGLVHNTESGPSEPTDATVTSTALAMHMTGYGTMDGGDGNCDNSTLTGTYSGLGTPLELSDASDANLPAITDAPTNLCGIFMILEPRAAGVTSGDIPSLQVVLSVSDGSSVVFTTRQHLFMAAALGTLDPTRVAVALDPLGWFSGVDLAQLSYNVDLISTIDEASQPETYQTILEQVTLQFEPQ